MCFLIDRKAKRPTQKKVFKVVKINPHTKLVHSPIKINTFWNQKSIIKIPKNARCSKLSYDYSAYRISASGIYVFLNRREAEDIAIERGEEYVVLELDVNPKDWIHTSEFAGAGIGTCKKGLAATYRRVKVSPRQNYIRWY